MATLNGKFFAAVTLLFTVLSSNFQVQGQQESKLLRKLGLLLTARNDLLAEVSDFKSNKNVEMALKKSRVALDNLKQRVEQFIRQTIPWSAQDTDLILRNSVDLEPQFKKYVGNLYKSDTLNEEYKNRLANFLKNAVQGDTTIIPSLKCLSVNGLPLSKLFSFSARKLQDITINDVCPNLESCASPDKRIPYPQSRGSEQNVREACTQDEKCDLKKALPMMAGILGYKVSDLAISHICPRQACFAPYCDVQESYRRTIKEIEALRSYVSIYHYNLMNWNGFFRNMIARKAHKDIKVALSMIGEKIDYFEAAQFVCYEAERVEPACTVGDIYREYTLMKKVQSDRSKPRRLLKDLRFLRQVNHAKMLEMQKENQQHLELLGGISSLDKNLQASVAGISKYFGALAKYDEGITSADTEFLSGSLNSYQKSLAKVEKKLKDDFQYTMTQMMAMLSANLASEIAKLTLIMIENSNPFKLLFSGPELDEIADQTAKVAEAGAQLARGTALMTAVDKLAKDSLRINTAFNGNNKQFTSLKEIVDKIVKGKAKDIDADSDLFLKEYASYTPQMDRSLLAKNNALWSAFKGAVCDLLTGEAGLFGTIPKAIAGGKLLCERLEGTLAQYFTLREDIFEFQFQLVDAVAKVVRGNIAQRLARNIKGKGDVVHAAEMIVASFIMNAKFQTTASTFCDILEYKQLGQPVKACSYTNGLLNTKTLDALIAYQDNTPFYEVQRDVYIPTRARFEGDTGYVDLNALERGEEEVLFKIPVNVKWLRDYNWIKPWETTVPFVEDIKLYLPQKEYKLGAHQEFTSHQVEMASISGSSVSTADPTTGVVYILPRSHTSYTTAYDEGYPSCSTQEIDNPYSLCNNLPKICDKYSRNAGQSLLPTILTTWSLRYTIYKGSKKIKWVAPKPETNLLLRAKVKLKLRKQSNQANPFGRSNIVLTDDGCCQGNMYRNSLVSRTCEECPAKTASMLRGLYCEIKDE